MSGTTGNLFDATESALGYLYQCRYALLLLVERSNTNPSVAMSIERFDDVSFEEGGQPTELIQTKHHIGQIRNLTDASSDLWKTLRVWSEAITNGAIDLEDMVLVIVTTATAPDGSIASMLKRENRNPVQALQKLIDVADTSLNKENLAAYTKFRSLTDTQKQALVQNIVVLDEAPNIEDALPQIKNELGYPVPLNKLDDFVSALEGWWFNTVVRHLMSDNNDVIRGQALHTKIDDLREKYRRDALPLDFCFVDPPDEPQPLISQRVYVKQLRVINSSLITISIAMCDHYKSFAQRSQWIRENLLLLDEWEKYESKLKDEWKRRFAWAKEELEQNPTSEREAKAGRDVYRTLQEQSFHIRPDCTEPIIMRGFYHDLADDKQVGWHPRFQELLNDEEIE